MLAWAALAALKKDRNCVRGRVRCKGNKLSRGHGCVGFDIMEQGNSGYRQPPRCSLAGQIQFLKFNGRCWMRSAWDHDSDYQSSHPGKYCTSPHPRLRYCHQELGGRCLLACAPESCEKPFLPAVLRKGFAWPAAVAITHSDYSSGFKSQWEGQAAERS